MFGFLRRKKPAPDSASPNAAETQPEADASAGAAGIEAPAPSQPSAPTEAPAELPAQPLQPDAAVPAAALPSAAAPAGSAKPGFFSRLWRGGPTEPTAEPAAPTVEPADAPSEPAAAVSEPAVASAQPAAPQTAAPPAALPPADTPAVPAAPAASPVPAAAHAPVAAAPAGLGEALPIQYPPEPLPAEQALPAAQPADSALDRDAASVPVRRVGIARALQALRPPQSLQPPAAPEQPALPLLPDSLSPRPAAQARPAQPALDAGPTPALRDQALPDATPPAPAADAPSANAPEEAEAALADEPAPRASWMVRLKQGLSKTRSNLGTLFVGVKVDEALFEDLETALLTADAGVDATVHLLDRLRETVRRERLTDSEQVKRALKDLVAEMLLPLEQPIDIDRAEPLVMMIAGVNGAGKTTSIGKLARHLHHERKSVLLAAGDTFRAAAREQLVKWGERNNVAVISQQGGDPAAVAFDAVSAARARGIEVVIVDTAGRLPTQLHLMEELKKVRRVVAKAMEGAPHETLLVLDGNTGQNALAQVKAFDEAVPLTGLVVTKLDGTAKGGALIALAHTRRDNPVPVYFIGVGEGIDDLQAFSSREFAEALFD